MRTITPAWCWDNLNGFDNFGSFNKAVNRIGYFSEYVRSNGAGAGEDTAVLDRSTATGFAGIAAQARSRSRMRLIGGRAITTAHDDAAKGEALSTDDRAGRGRVLRKGEQR